MYVAPGLLDRRLRFYRREEVGADGFARAAYVFDVERWGRIDRTAARQAVPMAPQAHQEARADAVATIGEGVAVDPFGIVRDTQDAALYWVRGVVPVRQVRAIRITLEAVDPTAYETFALYESREALGGVHLIEGAE